LITGSAAAQETLAELAITNKVPTIHGLREMVDAGGLPRALAQMILDPL
jgi:hypothetical protein